MITTAPEPVRPGRPRIVGLLVAWTVLVVVCSVPLLWLQTTTGLDPELLQLVQFAPALATGVLLVVARRRLRPLLPARVDARRVLRLAAIGVGITVLYGTILIALCHALGAAPERLPGVGTLAVMTVLAVIGSTGEELGWRGLMQPILEHRLGFLAAAVITGTVWALWHVQVFADPLAGLVFIASCIGLSLLFGAVTTGSLVQRGVVAGVLHGLVNIAIVVGADQDSELVRLVPLPLLFVAVLGGVVRWVTRRRLAAARASGTRVGG